MFPPTQTWIDSEAHEYLNSALSQDLIGSELLPPGGHWDGGYPGAALSQDWIPQGSHVHRASEDASSESSGQKFGGSAGSHLYPSPCIYYNLPEESLRDLTLHGQHPSAATTEEAANNMNDYQSNNPLHVGIHYLSENRRPRHTATAPTRIALDNNHEFSGSPGLLSRRTAAAPTTTALNNNHEFGGSSRPLSRRTATAPTTTAFNNNHEFSASPRPLSRRTVPRPATQYREFSDSPRTLSRRTTVVAYRPADLRHPHAFLDLNGYRGIRNDHNLLDCFEDCRAKRLAERGVGRRANMLVHLRQYHGQDIQRGG